jgi:hypothetical protein
MAGAAQLTAAVAAALCVANNPQAAAASAAAAAAAPLARCKRMVNATRGIVLELDSGVEGRLVQAIRTSKVVKAVLQDRVALSAQGEQQQQQQQLTEQQMQLPFYPPFRSSSCSRCSSSSWQNSNGPGVLLLLLA